MLRGIVAVLVGLFIGTVVFLITGGITCAISLSLKAEFLLPIGGILCLVLGVMAGIRTAIAIAGKDSMGSDA